MRMKCNLSKNDKDPIEFARRYGYGYYERISRTYQQDAVGRTKRHAVASGFWFSSVYVLATGGGKTKVAGEISLVWPQLKGSNERLFPCLTVDENWCAKLENYIAIPMCPDVQVGMRSHRWFPRNALGAPLQVASVQTLARRERVAYSAPDLTISLMKAHHCSRRKHGKR